jgi:hypothetical protein
MVQKTAEAEVVYLMLSHRVPLLTVTVLMLLWRLAYRMEFRQVTRNMVLPTNGDAKLLVQLLVNVNVPISRLYIMGMLTVGIV